MNTELRRPTRTGGTSRRGGPPALDLGLLGRLRALLLINIVPVLVLVALGIAWAQGRVSLRADAGHRLTALAVAVGACIPLAIAWWVLLPVARWLRDYPHWCFRHRSPVAWALPLVAGWTLWLALWLTAAAAILLALALIVSAAVQFLSR